MNGMDERDEIDVNADVSLTLLTPEGGGFLGYPANAVVYLPS
jgi:hypothetical protein